MPEANDLYFCLTIMYTKSNDALSYTLIPSIYRSNSWSCCGFYLPLWLIDYRIKAKFSIRNNKMKQ
jgi:hypothetical protein